MSRRSLFYALARASCLAILLSLIVGNALYAQGNSGKGGGGGNKGGGGSKEPEPQLPNYRFRVEKVDLEPIAAQFGAVDISEGARNSNLDALGHLWFEDGSFEPYLNLYTDDGYQAHSLGPWPEGAIFYLDPDDPDYNPNTTRNPGIILTDDLFVVLIVTWQTTSVFECDGEEFEGTLYRSEFVTVPIVEVDGTFAFGTPRLIKQFLAWDHLEFSRNRFGDILYRQRWMSDPDDPCQAWDETGLLVRNHETNEYTDTSINLSERLSQAGYDVERHGEYRIDRLNSKLQAIGTVDGIVYHYDILNDTVTDTDALYRNLIFLRHSDAGIVVGDKQGTNRGAMWDPLTGEVVEIPIDLGDGAGTRFVPLAIRDRSEMSGPNDVQVLGRIWNQVGDDFSEVPIYFEDGEAFFLQDLVTDDSPDSEWFRSLDPPRIRSTFASISADASRMMFRVNSWYYDSDLGQRIHSDPSLVILHRVQEGEGDDDGDTSGLDASVSVVDVGPRGRHMDVIAYVEDADGAAVSGVLVEVRVMHSDQVSFESGTTGSDGTVSWRYSNANADDYEAVVTDYSHPDYN